MRANTSILAAGAAALMLAAFAGMHIGDVQSRGYGNADTGAKTPKRLSVVATLTRQECAGLGGTIQPSTQCVSAWACATPAHGGAVRNECIRK